KRAIKFLTLYNYVHMQQLLWQNDHHTYKHEGLRVYTVALFNMPCYSSSRLTEICVSKCNVGCLFSTPQPDIQISFKREHAKGRQNSPKKYTLNQVLAVRPKLNETYWVLDWEDSVREDLVFLEMLASGPTKKGKNPNPCGTQCSDRALRADFLQAWDYMLLEERLSPKSMASGKWMRATLYLPKFAPHVTERTLERHYLHDMSNVDSSVRFLGLRIRTDLTVNFRSASMGRNPDLLLTLPAGIQHDLEMRKDYYSL
ncbi:hypothetical protein BS50DRAFT_509007, partial [Corynespora cassiicola Philippines]